MGGSCHSMLVDILVLCGSQECSRPSGMVAVAFAASAVLLDLQVRILARNIWVYLLSFEKEQLPTPTSLECTRSRLESMELLLFGKH